MVVTTPFTTYCHFKKKEEKDRIGWFGYKICPHLFFYFYFFQSCDFWGRKKVLSEKVKKKMNIAFIK